MTTPTTDSRFHEFGSPQRDISATVAGAAVSRATRETLTRWRVHRLVWVTDSLPHGLGTGPNRWAAASSEPENLGPRCWSGDVEVDVRSPLTAQAFHAMLLAEQVAYLRTWKPEKSNWDGPMREGLAGILQEEVKSQPLPFLENARQFTQLDPLYSTALVRGFSEGLNGKTVSDWKPFWAFANWVLAQPDPETEIRDEFTGKTRLGRRWQSCRLDIARFLDATLDGKLALLPLIERASVWQVIDALRCDPSPVPADEAREDECIMDPLPSSLNSVRGVAVNTVFSFIRWIRSHSPNVARGGQNLDDVPEAREALEACLNLQLALPLTIRSAFGANLTRLAYWAEAWLRDHLEQICPVPSEKEQPNIAWETFIRFCSVDSKTLALLREHYSAAILRTSQPGLAGHRRQDARVNLGKNLVMSYGHGMLDFEQPGDLLAAFFAHAPGSVRAEVMTFVGSSLAQSAGSIPPGIFARLLKLWNWLVQRENPAGGPGFQDRVA